MTVASTLDGREPASGSAYDELRNLLDTAESIAFSDPVYRFLYQEVMKVAVKSHVQGVRVLLAPLFQHNPLYAFLFESQSGLAVDPGSLGAGAAGAAAGSSQEGEGFELQMNFALPFRSMLPRFPLLPVAMASSFGHASSAELDARLGLSSDSAERAAARAASAAAGNPSGTGAVSSLMQSVSGGLGSLGFW